MEVNLDDVDFDRKLGLRLRQYRLECGLTQMALGDALGVSFQMIQKYENLIKDFCPQIAGGQYNMAKRYTKNIPLIDLPSLYSQGADWILELDKLNFDQLGSSHRIEELTKLAYSLPSSQ